MALRSHILITLLILGFGVLLWQGLLPGMEAILWNLWPGGDPAAEGPVRYEPVEIPPDYRTRLVVRDFPWPHPNPMKERNMFQGERPILWEDRLVAAVEAFRERYPQVDVEIDMRSFAEFAVPAAGGGREGDIDGIASSGSEADVAAVWWQSPVLDPDRIVPVAPYLTEDVRAAYHPLAWRLLERDGDILGWPRWMAFHYWFAPPGEWQHVVEQGWNIQEALSRLQEFENAGEPAQILVPPDAEGLIRELAAEPLRPASGEDGATAEADDPSPSLDQHLSEALEALNDWIAPQEAWETALGEAGHGYRFGLAGGFGPALGYRMAAPPNRDPMTLLPPPVVTGPPSRVPVMSAGAYVVFRKRGPNETVRAQLAMELARHLAEWMPENPVAQLLAFPAHRPSLDTWRQTAGDLGERLLADAAYAGSFGLRRFDPAAGRTGMDATSGFPLPTHGRN